MQDPCWRPIYLTKSVAVRPFECLPRIDPRAVRGYRCSDLVRFADWGHVTRAYPYLAFTSQIRFSGRIRLLEMSDPGAEGQDPDAFMA